jgi:TetR/AcrR family transcriptional regulator
MGRARSIEAKRERREQILAAAVDLLAREPYERLTMASVAAAAGLAKGTPYLYWRTKEELFLAALSEEYGQFWIELHEALRQAEPSSEAVARIITAEVVCRPRLISLIGLAHLVLERHAPLEAVIAFKRSILGGGLEVALTLCQRLPGLTLERASRFLIRVHGGIVALRQMCDPPEQVRAALELPELAMLRMEFEPDLYDLVLDLLVAARARSVDG